LLIAAVLETVTMARKKVKSIDVHFDESNDY